MGRAAKLKEARRAERRREVKRRAARQPRRWLYLLPAAALVIVLAVLGAALLAGRDSASDSEPASAAGSASLLAGRAIPIAGRGHVPEGTDVEYASNPPTSGDHWPEPAAWGVYDEPVPDEQAIHNLEHGGIWITYKGVDDAMRRQLEELAARYPEAVLLSPRPENESPIALASWGRLEELASFDEGRILNFITSNVNKAPEQGARIEPTTIAVGQPFPDFALTEAGGRELTPASLRGKPAIVWFTTSYCVPCQVGARVVARLDDELGGKAFDVLVVFVDPDEPPDALTWWRQQFAREDWLVAFDADLSLSQKVELRFLDTKFLLDRDGVIRDIDFQIADEDYLARVREAVEAGT